MRNGDDFLKISLCFISIKKMFSRLFLLLTPNNLEIKCSPSVKGENSGHVWINEIAHQKGTGVVLNS